MLILIALVGMSGISFADEVQSYGLSFVKDKQLVLFSNGKVEFGTLARDAQVQGVSFVSGTFLGFYKNQLLKYSELVSLTKVQGYQFESHTQIQYYGERDSDTAVYQNKVQIQYFLSLFPHQIEGIPCRAAQTYGFMISNGVYFYESGKLESCYLDKSTEINGIRYAQNQWLRLYESPDLRVCYSTLEQPKEFLGGVLCDGASHLKPQYWTIHFYETGSLAWCFLARDFVSEGVSYPLGVILGFDERGKVTGIKKDIWQ